MKLISLKIRDKFRSLQNGFEIKFRSTDEDLFDNDDLNQFHPFCFTGLNGSGKSNVLESLANIFYHLESCALKYKPDTFKNNFRPSISSPDAFELEYFIGQKDNSTYILPNLYKVKVVKQKKKKPKMQVRQYPFSDKEVWTNIDVEYDQSRDFAPSKIYLPDLIIAYSSGENEILSIPFIKTKLLQYDEYLQALENGEEYVKPESSLIYMDYELSQAVLLANILFQEQDVLEPLRTELGITKIRSFRLNINLHTHKFKDKNEIDQNVILTKQLNKKINKLKSCATCWYQDDESNRLVLDFYVDETTKRAVRNKDNFTDAFDFFRTLQILYVLNQRLVQKETIEDVYKSKGYYTEGKIPIENPSNQVFYFLDYYIEIKRTSDITAKELLMRQLSDGEHQFLHTMGICLLLKHHRTVILLDEPETHFNPDWRSKFIKILKKSLEVSGNNNLLTDIMLTSHSPFIIADCLPSKVIVFKKMANGDVKAVSSHSKRFNTFGTSVSLILEEVFNKKESIPFHSLETLKEIENRDFQTLEQIQEAKTDSIILGESVEKALLFRKLILKEMEISNNLNNA